MAKMVTCKACGADIAKGAKSCPSCGKDNRSFFAKHKIISVLLVLVFLVVGVNALGGSKDSGSAATGSTNNSTDSTVAGTKITYDNFMGIKMGMTYDEVTAILGAGSESSSSEISGIKTVMYTWSGSGLGNMNVTVQNGEVTGKAQMGLMSMNAKITLEKYNQVKEGMSYTQVKGILGEGQVVSQTKIMDTESIMYEWINSDATNANLTFSGNKLMAKAQFNLK